MFFVRSVYPLLSFITAAAADAATNDDDDV